MSDLRKFAESLINADCKSVEKMAKLLEEEYGIVAAAPPVSGRAGRVPAPDRSSRPGRRRQPNR